MNNSIKWSQWDSNGLYRCGFADYNTIMGWVRDLGKDAKKCIDNGDLLGINDNAGALYGRVCCTDSGEITEVRLYCEAYVDEDQMKLFVSDSPNDIFYVAYKH